MCQICWAVLNVITIHCHNRQLLDDQLQRKSCYRLNFYFLQILKNKNVLCHTHLQFLSTFAKKICALQKYSTIHKLYYRLLCDLLRFSGFQECSGNIKKGSLSLIAQRGVNYVEDSFSFQHVSRKNEKIEIQCHGIPDEATGLRRNAPKNSCCIISPNLYRC